jgi:hypothetical protein
MSRPGQSALGPRIFEALETGILRCLEENSSLCCDNDGDRRQLAAAIAKELPMAVIMSFVKDEPL